MALRTPGKHLRLQRIERRVHATQRQIPLAWCSGGWLEHDGGLSHCAIIHGVVREWYLVFVRNLAAGQIPVDRWVEIYL